NKKIMKNEKGFSLVELLVVVIIIAIIAAIAIPNLLASRRAANEASAVQSLRTIHSAQATFFATEGTGGYGTLGTGTGTLNGAGVIDPALASATVTTTKSGYSFTDAHDSGDSTFCTSAAPASGQGTRSFAVSTDGVIWRSSAD